MLILWGWVGTLKACPTMHLERLPITDQVRDYILRNENICSVRSGTQKTLFTYQARILCKDRNRYTIV